MPRSRRDGNWNAPNGYQQQGCWAETVAFPDGSTSAVMIYVWEDKAAKHAIGGYWPQGHGAVHTGVTVDEVDFAPLYKTFGRDLAAACKRNHNQTGYYVLEYDANELPTQPMSGNVYTGAWRQISTLEVGGSVTYTNGSGYLAVIHHGPISRS